jgi:hypothetical protein
MAMAKKEGWATKSGSKWQTMPDLMIRYRAAAFWGRLYIPELLVGIQTEEEVVDVEPITVREEAKPKKVAITELNEQIKAAAPEPEPMEADLVEDELF